MEIGKPVTTITVIDTRGGGTKTITIETPVRTGADLINAIKSKVSVDSNTVITDMVNFIEVSSVTALSGDTFKVSLTQRTTKGGF